MYQNNACILNGKHTFYDWGLYVGNNAAVEPPAVRTNFIEIPGRNGNIDMTETLSGRPVYGNRVITLELGGKVAKERQQQFVSDFVNAYHGRRVTVEFDRDREWYYEGRATISGVEISNTVVRMTMTVDADPYKYSRNDRLPKVKVDGSASVRVEGSPLWVVPEFDCSAAMEVTFEGKSYQLNEGKNKLYDILLKDQSYTMTFSGTGTVEIIYRRGRL